MAAYGIALLRPAPLKDDIIDYIDLIQTTMDPYGGSGRHAWAATG